MPTKARNFRNGRWLAQDVEVAASLFSKARGLLGRKSIPPDYGLLVTPCNSIHSFFMAFPFDALFLDKNNTVVHVIHSMPSYRISPILRKAHSVLELPTGTARATGTVVGDVIEMLDESR